MDHFLPMVSFSVNSLALEKKKKKNYTRVLLLTLYLHIVSGGSLREERLVLCHSASSPIPTSVALFPNCLWD